MRAQVTPGASGRPAAFLVGLAFTVSGFTSLVLEVVWSKALAQLLGSTLHSMSTVVAAYLGGLALGAWLCGRVVHRVARPLRLYGMLEIGVGLYAFVSLAIIHALDPWVGRAYSSLGPASPAYPAVRVGLAALVLLPPTLLMGGTLPALVSWATRGGSGFGASLGRLYGLNTLGAVGGAALAGFRLVPELGLLATTRAAGGLAILIGVMMVLWGGRSQASRTAPEPPPWKAEAHPVAPAPTILLFGLSGAVALVLEITWARVFSLVFGSSVYSFALVLANYLFALALGSMLWGGRLADGPRPWRAFARLQIVAALGAAVGLWALPHLPRLFLTVLMERRADLASVFLLQSALASLVMFLPCLAFGAIFPVGTRLVAGGRMEGARATGVAYAVNTGGTLAGSLAAGFLLLPTIGVHATWVGAILLSLVLGVVAWRADARSRAAAAAPAMKPLRTSRSIGLEWAWIPTIAAVVLLTLTAPRWNRSLFTLGAYRTSYLVTSGIRTPDAALRILDLRLASDEILFYAEGLHGVVSVHADRAYPGEIALRVNGKTDASTGSDIATQVLVGHVPMLWAPPRARVCIIGHGSGVTTRAALTHDPERLTVIEIEPQVILASRFFDAYTDTVLGDPRVELILEDGRQHLLHSGRQYDVIISEPSNPWIAGINNLFTVDYYRRARAALRPHGVFCQWVQFYELSAVAQSSLLSSFTEVFPNGEVFFLNYDLLLVAPPLGERVKAERLFVRDSSSATQRYLHRFGLDDDGAVAATHVGRLQDFLSQLPPAPRNTDDRPFIEYRAPIDLYQVPKVKGVSALAERQPLAGLARWVDPAALPRAAGAAGISLVRLGQIDRARVIARELRQAGGEQGTRAAFDISRAADQAERERRLATHVDSGHRALDAGDLLAARRAANLLLREDPENAAGHLIAAGVALRQDSLSIARRELALVLAHGSTLERCGAHEYLGVIAMAEGRVDVGRAQFEASRALMPAAPRIYLFLSKFYLQTGRMDSAQIVLEEGLRRASPRAELLKALEALRTKPAS